MTTAQVILAELGPDMSKFPTHRHAASWGTTLGLGFTVVRMHEDESATGRSDTRSPFTLFAILWGSAAIFHVLGPSGRSTGVLEDPSLIGVNHAVLAAAGVWLMLRPSSRAPLVAVAVLGLSAAWHEAPVLGNHWWLASCVNVAILISLAIATRRSGFDAERFRSAVLPTSRLCLVGFYPFAAFAKLNEDFFDTSVSCAAVFFDETAKSYGLSTPIAVDANGIAALVPIGTAVTELSIPALLLMPRTRMLGVIIGLTFHSAIALDLDHLFIDFTTVLAALFTLFLPVAFGARATELVAGRFRPFFLGWILLVSAILIVCWLRPRGADDFADADGPMLAWFPVAAALLFGVAGWSFARANRRSGLPQPLQIRGPGRLALAAVPLFVALNGLAPYLELRTAFSYTMYANLQMVDGESNHLLVRSSLPVGDRLDGLVTIIRTDDIRLRPYVKSGYALPWDSFRAYVADNRDSAIVYERAGKRSTIVPGDSRPAAPALLVRKLMPLRAVDLRDPPRCQESFLPAL